MKATLQLITSALMVFLTFGRYLNDAKADEDTRPRYEIGISGMVCQYFCVQKVKDALRWLPNVSQIEVSYDEAEAFVTLKAGSPPLRIESVRHVLASYPELKITSFREASRRAGLGSLQLDENDALSAPSPRNP